MDTDPVCGMTVGRGDVGQKSAYQGKTYYFCSPACKERFDSNPFQYAVKRISEG
jgi:YHS domain-containing protein